MKVYKQIGVLILLLLTIHFISCENDEGWTTVSGIVTDDAGGNITNKRIIIRSIPVTFCDICNSDSIYETFTDDQGKYEISFFAKKDFIYSVVSELDSCYLERSHSVRTEKENHLDINITRIGNLIFGYESAYDNAQLHYRLTYETGGYIASSDIAMIRTEPGQPYLLYFQDIGISVFTVLEYEIENGNEIIGDSVWLKPPHCDTITYIINYPKK